MIQSHESVLLVGDDDRELNAALAQAMPMAKVTAVASYFDAIVELSARDYTTVLAAAEPIERRPEAAVQTLREMLKGGRLLLFGHPTLEPLSRKMLEFGCDDYIVTPASAVELQQMIGAPTMRLAPAGDERGPQEQQSAPVAGRLALLSGISLAEILLDSILHHPQNSTAAAIERINELLGPTMQVIHVAAGKKAPKISEGMSLLSHATRVENRVTGTLHLIVPRDEDETGSRHLLAQFAHLVGRLGALEDQHRALQKLAITDELTGLYNGRFFKYTLARLIERAKTQRSPVTLLLFDIDDFKRYNDQYGHAVGDDILRQTAALMRRTCRPHDVVARISGDEFAVIFWEKEGPRQPRDPKATTPASRVPQSVEAIVQRFLRAIASPEFNSLGPSGKGVLTISGALAVYPFDAATAEELVNAADRELMFGVKRRGKNNILLVGSSENGMEMR